MKRSVFIIFICLSFSLLGQSDEEPKPKFKAKNAIYLEVLGTSGSLTSIGFDQVFAQGRISFYSISTGIGYFPAPIEGGKPIIGVPLSVNYNTGYTNAHFEFGLGLCYSQGLYQEVYTDYSGNFGGSGSQSLDGIFLTNRIGLRLQDPQGGFFFRFAATPYVRMANLSGDYPDTNILLLGSLAFGASF